MNRTAVALLAKTPVPGQVKTRFCPPCTPAEAAAFARAFLMDTAAMLDEFDEVDRWCSYAGPADELRDLLGGELLLQRGDDLGPRIANATADLFDEGYERVIVMCADAPTVDAAYFRQTLKLMDDHDIVFAPARDGGCLHVALSRPAEFLFRNVEMSTDHVFADMVRLSDQQGYSHTVLAERFDLDYLRDLTDAVAAGELTHAQHTNAALKASRFSHRTVTTAELDAPLWPFDDAVSYVLENTDFLDAETLSLQASGLAERVLAIDATSTIDVPPFASSSMDGYAVNAGDTTIVGAPKIMTGWAIPTGYDTVVPWEHLDGETVRPNHPIVAGQFIRPQGEDVHAGAVIVRTGTALTPGHLGLLAACGHATATVFRRPRVAVLVTGDELVEPGTRLMPNKIYDSDSVILRALLERAGADVVSVTHISDSEADTTQWFEQQSNVDALVTAGGASVGEHDWVRTVLGKLGTVDVWRIALKPGKPFAFGRMNNVPVFVLPGNPASVLACSHAFVLPALRKMQGLPPLAARFEATLTTQVHTPDDRTFLCPVLLNGAVATPMRAASSSVVSNHLDANGYALVPPGGLDVGASVIVELFN